MQTSVLALAIERLKEAEHWRRAAAKVRQRSTFEPALTRLAQME